MTSQQPTEEEIAARMMQRLEPSTTMLLQMSHPNGRDMIMQVVALPVAMFEQGGLVTPENDRRGAWAQQNVSAAINGLFSAYSTELAKIKADREVPRGPRLIT